MADNIFLGTAGLVNQEQRFTPGGTIEVGDKFIITIKKEGSATQSLTVSATGTTAAQVCTDIQAAAAVNTQSYFTAFTWTDQTTYVKALQNTNTGQPYTFTVSTTESDNSPADAQTFATTTQVESSGPNNFKAASNWSLGSAPDTDAVIVLENCDVDILYGLDYSGVSVAGYRRDQSFTGLIGDGTNYLQIKVDDNAVCHVGYHYGGTTTPAGPAREMVDWGTSNFALHVWGTASTAEETAKQPSRFLFNHSSTILHVHGTSKVGVAANVAGETSTLATVYVYDTAVVLVTSGVTLATLSTTGGTVTCLTAPTTFTNNGGTSVIVASGTITNLNVLSGTVTTAGTVAVTNLTVKGGLCYSNSKGTVTTGALEGGTLDFTQSNEPRTVTSLQSTLHGVHGPATLKVDDSIVTITGKYEVVGRGVLATAA